MNKKFVALFISILMIISAGLTCISFASSRAFADTNGDGKVNAKDARLVLRYAARLESLDDEAVGVSDVNYDGKVNSKDARLILRSAARLEVLVEKSTEPESEEQEETTTPATDPATESTTESTTEKTETLTYDDLPDDVKAFIDAKFYFEGTMTADGTTNNATMAVNGDDVSISMNVDGMILTVLKLNGTYYLANPSNKTYIKLTSAVMKTMGIDESDINISFAQIDKSKIIIERKENVNNTYTDYIVTSGDTVNHFYMKNNELVKVMCCDANDNLQSVMAFTTFTSEIPSSALSISGYKKSLTVMSFIMGLIN